MILSILALLCLFIAIALLVILSIIDLKTLLLPNVYNAALAASGVAFHAFTMFSHLLFENIIIGAVIGGGFLYLIRFVSNRIYNQDTLGLGDVKLLAAGGVWLGPEMIFTALVVGALAGVAHGVFIIIYDRIKTGKFHSITTFSIPAGPGFAVGIFIAGLVMYTPFVQSLF